MRTKVFLIAAMVTGLAVTASPAAHSAQRADDVLAARAWHPDAARISYGYYFDPTDSKYHVSFPDRNRAVGTALSRALGDQVAVSYTAETPTIQAGDRFNNLPPFTGGAFITPDSPTARQCTSGFAIRDGFGVLGSVTAGHCAGHGNIVNYHTGAGLFYGQTQGSLRTTTRDMARLHGFFTVSYEPFIHTDPGAPTKRRVIGKGDPTLTTPICVSGSITGARCSITMISLSSGTACDEFGCTSGLMVGRRPGVTIVQGGDSGGPVYSQSGTADAIIRGMIIGEASPDTVLMHKISDVESGLGVTVATA
ncbi:chymotrypsin family serine protease [Kibdelosporangium aridum]|uniref:Serine protease n=1 Tax=Kibdelosporangium aridum TaxID=2030 RepID=A0A1Y5Y355_KIBAR|nr:hypothetical protein [Kibdelosporangium aridum]SMD24912.1 hypothetical protein SAMN05661093_08785 [Kibdelosporangium aridum]